MATTPELRGSEPGSSGPGVAEPRGAASLSQLDLDQAAAFGSLYAERPPAPVAVVIAAYNEEASVGTVVAAVPGATVRPGHRSHRGRRRVVGQDGADGLGGRRPGVRRPLNRGQGAALRLGYLLARQRGARFILTSDADGQYQSDDMERVLAPLVNDEADFVSGSRRLGSTTSKDAVRNLGVVLFAGLITVLVRQKVTDPSCGIRAMRAEVTADVVLDQPQYQASELLIGTVMAGYRYKEVPIAMKARRHGKTKKGGNLLYGARFCSVVVGTWLRERRRSTKTKRS